MTDQAPAGPETESNYTIRDFFRQRAFWTAAEAIEWVFYQPYLDNSFNQYEPLPNPSLLVLYPNESIEPDRWLSARDKIVDFLASGVLAAHRVGADGSETPISAAAWDRCRVGDHSLLRERDVLISAKEVVQTVGRQESGSVEQSSLIAALCANATPAIQRDKPFADKAAELIRTGQAPDRAKAIRMLGAIKITGVDEANVESAIRRAFDAHYDPRGMPHQN
jgi:hypothetical protein